VGDKEGSGRAVDKESGRQKKGAGERVSGGR